jgi:hypothetical protein
MDLTWSNEIRTTERQVVKLSSEVSLDFQRKFGMKLQDAITVEFNIVVYGDLFSGLTPTYGKAKFYLLYPRNAFMLDSLFMHFLFVNIMTMNAFVR